MEIIAILGLALLFFGPSRLPGLGDSLGKGIRSFKKAMAEDPEAPAKPQLPPSQNVPPQA